MSRCDCCHFDRDEVPADRWLNECADYGGPAAKGWRWMCFYCHNSLGMFTTRDEAIFHVNRMLNLIRPVGPAGHAFTPREGV